MKNKNYNQNRIYTSRCYNFMDLLKIEQPQLDINNRHTCINVCIDVL